jgi:hypothetical protein
LCIKKDLIELSQWSDVIEDINTDLDHFKIIERQLIKSTSMANHLQGLRRKNTLVMGALCQYERELRKEFEFGKRDYDINRAKEHEKKRDLLIDMVEHFRKLKSSIYGSLSSFHRR